MRDERDVRGAAPYNPRKGIAASASSSLRSVQNQHPLDAVNRCKTDARRTSCNIDGHCETAFRRLNLKLKNAQV